MDTEERAKNSVLLLTPLRSYYPIFCIPLFQDWNIFQKVASPSSKERGERVKLEGWLRMMENKIR